MTAEERLEQIRLCGSDPNAYATLQSALNYYDHSRGYIAYRRVLRGHVALGDPVTSPDYWVDVFKDYLATNSNTTFSYLSEDASKALIRASKKTMYFVNIGVERCIDLKAELPYPSSVSGALKKAKKANLQISEQDLSRMPPEQLDELKNLNKSFLQGSATGKEIGFISRCLCFEYEKEVRFFSIQAHGEPTPIGFCVLDPWYRQGNLVGYQLHQFRLGPTKIWGVYASVVAMLADLLKAEGLAYLSLGGCLDLSAERDPSLPSSRSYDILRTASFRLVDRYHPLTNLSGMKLAFAGFNINRYMAASHKIPVLPVARFAKANNMPLLPKW